MDDRGSVFDEVDIVASRLGRLVAASPAHGREEMSTSTWIVSLSIVAGILTLSFWDDELDPRTAAWLRRAHVSLAVAENAYYPMVGLSAPAGQSPQRSGREKVHSYELGADSRPAEPAALQDPGAQQRLLVEVEVDTLCEVEQEPCLEEFSRYLDSIAGIVLRHQELLDRYHALASYRRYVSTATPGEAEPRPDFELLEGLNRIHHAEIGAQFVSGDRLRSAGGLARDLRFVRMLLAEADSLPLKASAIRMLARDLHLLSELLDSRAFLHPHLPDFTVELASLDARERSLALPMRREFQSISGTFLERHPTEILDPSSMPDWLMGFFYKPNASVNRLLAAFEEAQRRDALDASSLAERGAEIVLPVESPVRRLLNPVGSILADRSRPEFSSHLAQLRDLEGLLRLVRVKQAIRANSIGPDRIHEFLARRPERSPYFNQPFQWDSERQVLMFEGLSRDQGLQRIAVPFS